MSEQDIEDLAKGLAESLQSGSGADDSEEIKKVEADSQPPEKMSTNYRNGHKSM